MSADFQLLYYLATDEESTNTKDAENLLWESLFETVEVPNIEAANQMINFFEKIGPQHINHVFVKFYKALVNIFDEKINPSWELTTDPRLARWLKIYNAVTPDYKSTCCDHIGNILARCYDKFTASKYIHTLMKELPLDHDNHLKLMVTIANKMYSAKQ